ncbi:MFS transporter [Subtercola frigoramans]|uniref:MFS family permease n=1 Tax=Subtercola frigoramans TaxID=120298 RepID=A0ABS2L4K6_9MICO|nr:MFS transporter [Subtercola frigoramans]MBM7472007.1 MFS family permease [Subtercola frigoramans]
MKPDSRRPTAAASSGTDDNADDGTREDASSVLTEREKRRLTKASSERAIIATLAFTGLIAAFMQTLVTPITPQLPLLLNTTASNATWILTATLLAAAISTPISGRLGDMFGKRRMVLVLLVLLLAGSVVSALSNDVIVMILGRVLQGTGLGVIALGVSILRDVLHPARLGAAVALVSATLGIGGAVGLPVSALIAQNLDWHFLFWLAGLLALAALVLVFLIVPVSTLRTGGSFDFIGAIGFAIGLVGILLAVSKGSEWGWTSPVTLGMLGGGVLVLLLWGWFELRTTNPLVDLRIAARRPVLLTNLASITVGFAFFASAAVLPQLLEAPTSTGVGLGQSLLIASLCLMPSGLVMFFMSPVAARLSAARGPRTSLVLGGIIIAVGYALAIGLMTEVWHAVFVATAVGFGVGFAYAAMPTLIMHAVPATETAAANGLNSVMRSLGSTVAAAVLGLILSSNVIISAGRPIPTQGAFQLCFAIAASVALLGVVAAFFIPRREPAYRSTSIPQAVGSRA